MKEPQERILKVLFVLIWSLALIHMTAEYYYLYWRISWFDMLTHFLGGMWLGIASLWAFYFSGYLGTRKMDGRAFFIAIMAGSLLGFLWELYEYVVWQWSGEGLPLNYIPDTRLDMIMDLVGAVAGYFAVTKLLNSPRTTGEDLN